MNYTVPTTEAQVEAETNGVSHRSIQARFNNSVDVIETKFHFKKTEDKETGLSYKRPTVILPMPRPSVEGIVSILENGDTKPKQLELLLDAVESVINQRARELVNENEEVTAETFPYELLSWEAIANIPKAERRGGGIPKELWEEFAQDYIATMPAVTGKTIEQVTKATGLFLKKFSPVKSNKPVLKLLRDQLTIYISNSENVEQYTECVDALNDKIEKLLSMDDEELIGNL